eukprot:XP_001693441.1 predicted protein [Chlamydomonas reinhardtii]
MDFSESFRSSGPHPAFSPDGRFVATVVEYRLIIREVETLRVVQLYSCLDRIDSIEWSCNSAYVLCGLCSRGVIQVGRQESGGEVSWLWGTVPRPRKLAWRGLPMCVAIGCIHTAVRQDLLSWWACCVAWQWQIDTARHELELYVACCRSDMKDWVTVYDCGSGWGEAARFQLPTADAADIAWSPAGGVLAAWESCLGDKVRGAVWVLGGKEGLGVKCVSWSPAGELLAVGGYDGRLRLLNGATWTPLLEAAHPGRVAAPAGLVVYREPASAGATPTSGVRPAPGPRSSAATAAAAAAADPNARTHYAIDDLPAAVPGGKPALDAPGPPRLGVGRCVWSADGRYAASLEDCRPGSVWVWDAGAMELAALLMHLGPVTDLAWGPRGHTLAVATGSTRVYLWTPAGASIIHIPLAQFQAYGCSWNNSATTLLLRGPEAFCCAYLTA